jgi:hypothetical protein
MHESRTSLAAAPPVVSVVLPTFNRLSFLRAAVDSVFAQTFADWELIIADDGSDEATRAYLQSLEGRAAVRVIWMAHCGVPGAVRNAALQQARGEYVAFLDSDDQWQPVKLQRQIAGLRARPERRWSYTGYIRIDAAGELEASLGYEQRVRHSGAILEPLLMNAVDIWTPAVVVERRLLAQVGGFNEKLPVYEDYDLWLRLASQSDIDLIDEPLICVRFHDQHYRPGAGAASMAMSRHRSLQALQDLLKDSQLRTLVGRVQARSALDLASLHAETDRLAAARTVVSGCGRSWRYRQWWAGLPRVLLKLLVPHFAIDAYRHRRRARDKGTGGFQVARR